MPPIIRFGLGLLLCTAFATPLLAQTQTKTPSFVNDVEPILTRFGCNQGSCHGKGSGQNGFKLSLRGYAPEWDHAWITARISIAPHPSDQPRSEPVAAQTDRPRRS